MLRCDYIVYVKFHIRNVLNVGFCACWDFGFLEFVDVGFGFLGVFNLIFWDLIIIRMWDPRMLAFRSFGIFELRGLTFLDSGI